MNLYELLSISRGRREGVCTQDFYEADLSVLNHIGLKSKGTNVLFSAVPSSKPYYHLLAIVHDKNLPKTEGFEKKEVAKNQFYLQKDFKLGTLDIRQVMIPFEQGKKMMSLVYYHQYRAPL